MNTADAGAEKDLAEAGGYSDVADAGADRKGVGADKRLAFGSADKACRCGCGYGPCFWECG